jgi:chemotaxis protein MotA
MNYLSLIDVPSAVVVVGGTLLATLLRCGWRDCHKAVTAVAALGQRRFDAEYVRSELAVQVQEIRQDGLLRASPHQIGDSEFDEVTGTLIARRSVPALIAAHESHKARRLTHSNIAIRTLSQASELAPVLGLAGTLLALTQLPRTGVSGAAYAETISMAVLTTLYGLIAANFLFAPLARMVDRKANAEEAERQKILDWLAEQVASACQPRRSSPAERAPLEREQGVEEAA